MTCIDRDNFHVVLYSLVTTYYQYQINISSRFSSNSEANVSELLKNLEEIDYIHSKTSTTHYAVKHRERVKQKQ